METPSIVFYEHSFDDTTVKSLAKSVLNLGNECRALSEENTRLKAEVERLRASSFVTAVPVEQYERLRKAGDYLCSTMDTNGIHDNGDYEMHDKAIAQWTAAKEGKPSV